MKQVLPLTFALAVGLIAGAQAQKNDPTPQLREGTPVEIVGQITSDPKAAANEHKMQVGVGPQKLDYTIHFKDARLSNLRGGKIDEDAFKDGQWVHAKGFIMDDPRRIKATEVHIVGRDLASLRGTPYERRGYGQGYVVVTGSVPKTAAGFSEGTRVVLVAPITSPPKGALNEHKMQVAVGPEKTDYTVHFRDARLIGFNGQKIDEDGFDDGQWVRVEGTMMDDPRRIKADRVQIVAKDNPALKRSAFYRPGYDTGYVMAVAGSREIYPTVQGARFAAGPMTIVGRVSDDTGPLNATRKIQIDSAGNTWTGNVTDKAAVVDENGKPISVHEVHKGQWVRVTGWQTDDLRMRVLRVEELGPQEAYQQSKFFRNEYPLGYVERSIGTRTEFPVVRLNGVVQNMDPTFGYFVLKTPDGTLHRVYTDDVVMTGPNGAVDMDHLRTGDTISVEGRTIDLDLGEL